MPSQNPHAGQAVYTQRTLKLYDFVVLGISNRWIWECPTARLLAFYNQHISSNHLDVGVGTGYFLDHCNFRSTEPRVELLDLNTDSLTSTAQRIARYQPITHRANVLEPLDLNSVPFDSIGLNYLLHCLPGTLEQKAITLDHLNPLLKPDGTLFGSTLLQDGVTRSAAARRLMAFYNSKGIFNNEADSLEGLQQALDARYQDWHTKVHGCGVLFWAKQPKSP